MQAIVLLVVGHKCSSILHIVMIRESRRRHFFRLCSPPSRACSARCARWQVFIFTYFIITYFAFRLLGYIATPATEALMGGKTFVRVGWT